MCIGAARSAYLILYAQVTPRHRIDRMRRLTARALSDGASRSGLAATAWDLAGNCLAPVTRNLAGYKMVSDLTNDSDRPRELLVRPGGAMFMDLQVRCRRCVRCRRHRAALWRARARNECAIASRTWFGTLTLSPNRQAWVTMNARKLAEQRVIEWSSATQEDVFKLRCAVIGAEFTRYLKRVRKNSGAPLRYLLVSEAHKSGLPHLHMLVHQQRELQPILYDQLKKPWHWGFVNFKLVDDHKRSAAYVCKYLSKSMLVRVRASLRYGVETPDGLNHSEVEPR